MKAIVLAAGYATRLYPLTESQPKPLINIAAKPMIEYVLDNLLPAHDFECVYVVTNSKFASQFEKWMDNYRKTRPELKIDLFNNGSFENSHEPGAITNLHLVLTHEKIDDDIIVVAADNLFDQSLEGFIQFARQKKTPVVAVYDIDDLENGRSYNSIIMDDDGRITFFEEKPEHPQSRTIGIALYYYPKSSLPLINDYIREGNKPDQPGCLVEWMYSRVAFYTWRMPGIWFDAGTKEALENASRYFAKVLQSNA